MQRGTYLGCRKCVDDVTCTSIMDTTQDGQKRYDHDVLHLDYLQASEDTAFDIQLLMECGSLRALGALPFSTYASTYDKRFGYNRDERQDDENPGVKRMKRYVPSSRIHLSNSQCSLFSSSSCVLKFFNLVPRAFLRRGEDGREKTLASADHVIFKHPEELGVID